MNVHFDSTISLGSVIIVISLIFGWGVWATKITEAMGSLSRSVEKYADKLEKYAEKLDVFATESRIDRALLHKQVEILQKEGRSE